MQEVSICLLLPLPLLLVPLCMLRGRGLRQMTQKPSGACSQATEDFLVHLFEDCNLCAIHAKRVTISTP